MGLINQGKGLFWVEADMTLRFAEFDVKDARSQKTKHDKIPANISRDGLLTDQNETSSPLSPFFWIQVADHMAMRPK